MTPLQLKQLVAAGGIAGELATLCLEQQGTLEVAAKIMKEMQEKIDNQRSNNAEDLKDAYLNGAADARCEKIESLPDDASIAADIFVKVFTKHEKPIEIKKDCDTCVHNGNQSLYPSGCTGCFHGLEYSNYKRIPVNEI